MSFSRHVAHAPHEPVRARDRRKAETLMGQANLSIRGDQATTVTLVAAGSFGDNVRQVLAQRGVPVVLRTEHDLPAASGNAELLVWAPTSLDVPTSIVRACVAATRHGIPALLLLPPPTSDASDEERRAVALAHLRAAGAALFTDPDAWIEATVLCARFGVPKGPRIAVIAAPGGLLEAAADMLAYEATLPRTISLAAPAAPSDAVLYELGLNPIAGLPLTVPVVAREELRGEADALVGLRAALSAMDAVGRAVERAREGAASNRAALGIDDERAERQLAKIGPFAKRIGDHETKVLLASYGVNVIRQAVATTPSAAIRLAKKVGFPVEIRAWGPEAPMEIEGALVERDLQSASDVRRAMMAVAGGTSGVDDEGPAVIVRETPATARELTVVYEDIAGLGWTCRVIARGAKSPAAAPAPLTKLDAETLAGLAMATRSGERSPDLAALAECLLRASHLAVALRDRCLRLTLGRLLVGDRVLVVDAATDLRPR